jgi:probable H4MPT-linked C1 transfer pathway protein
MGGVTGLDVGGANTKAVWRDGDEVRAVTRPYEVWHDRDGLIALLREVSAALPAPERIALTMTAELSDAFRTKREGVAFVLDAAEAALPAPLSVMTTAGELVSVAEARARPLAVAAANWMAAALAVAAVHPDALMLDVGSTTADVIPIAGGRVAATGRDDLSRLLAGELVYTGALRTNLAAVAARVPVGGEWCPVASELFATSADVHLALGHLAPGDCTCPMADGRPADVEHARERIARLVCADAEQLGADAIERIAEYLHAEQVTQIAAAARRVTEATARRAADAAAGKAGETAARPVAEAAARQVGEAPIVPLGGGAFLARAAAARLGRSVLEMPWSEAERGAAPAAALARLARC